MSSTNKTPNLGLTQYIGTDVFNPLTDYNVDMSKVDTKFIGTDSHIANHTIHNVKLVCSKEGTIFNLTGLTNTTSGIVSCYFVATSDYSIGDTFTIDSKIYTIQTTNNESLKDKYFVNGAIVSILVDVDGSKISFIGIPTPSQVGVIVSNPNLLINGDFKVWQRGTTFANCANIYTADRWLSGYQIDTNVKIYRTNPIENGYQYSLRMEEYSSIGGANSLTDIVQNVEDYKDILGRTVTMSVRIKIDSGVQAFIYAYDGASYMTSPTIIGDGTIKTITYTCNPSISGSRFEFSIRFIRNSLTVGTGVNIQYAKLELGSIATPFLPSSYAEELALCQRYYQKITDGMAIGFVQNTNSAIVYYDYVVPMRINPTLMYPSTYAVFDVNGNHTGTDINMMSYSDDYHISLSIDSSGLTTGSGAALSLPLEPIQFDAEIY